MAIFTEEYCANMLDEFDNRLEGIEFTPEQIQKICEDCKSIKFTIAESYILESASPKADLSKLGIKNADSQVKSAATKISTAIKKNGVTSETKKQIHNIVSDLFDDLAKSLDKSVMKGNPNLQNLDQKNLAKGFTLTIWDVIINTLICDVLTIMLGPMGNAIFVSVGAPIVEEASKAIAVKGGFSKEYTIIFNTFEFTNYMVSYNLPFINKLRARTFAIGMHLVNTAIHNLFASEKFRKQFHIDDSKDSKDKCTFASYIITTLIHCAWNTAPKFSPALVKIITGIEV